VVGIHDEELRDVPGKDPWRQGSKCGMGVSLF
jgi:hypothetical protein